METPTSHRDDPMRRDNALPRLITRKPVLPSRPEPSSNGNTSTPVSSTALKQSISEHAHHPVKVREMKSGSALPEEAPPSANGGTSDGDEPPPYDEAGLQAAYDANERALNELDLNASPTAIESPLDFEENLTDGEEAHASNPGHNEDTATSPKTPKWKAAYETTKHFAGGLIAHPVESTKHFSVLRHSHGIVAYRGLATNVAITLFADDSHVVPADRTIWLQQRGWSGQRGMKLKAALGRRGTWHEVTPQARVTADAVQPADEKAWQRDIGRFLRSAGASKAYAHRQAIETCVIRIPVAATDGYFRLLVCAGADRSVILCPSPVFRVVSLSTSSASLRGASLATLPLELGLKVLTSTAVNLASQGTAPVVNAIQNRFGAVAPGWVTQGARVGYDAGSWAVEQELGDKLEAARQSAFEEVGGEERPVLVGEDAGPAEPYPLRFSGKVVRGAGKSNVETGLPTANLSGVRDEIKTRLHGIYFGWGSIEKSDSIASDKWRPLLLFARPPDGVPSLTPKTILRAFIVEDFEGANFYDARLSVIIMGFIRSWEEVHPDQFRNETCIDIMIARQSLDRPAWQAEATLQRLKSQTTLSDRLISTQQLGQRQIDRIPFEKLAIRMPKMALKEGATSKGGLSIDRRAINAVPQ